MPDDPSPNARTVALPVSTGPVIGSEMAVEAGASALSANAPLGSPAWMSLAMTDLARKIIGDPGAVVLDESLRIAASTAGSGGLGARVVLVDRDAPSGATRFEATFYGPEGSPIAAGTLSLRAANGSGGDFAARGTTPGMPTAGHDRFGRFIAEARNLPPLLTAVVHPCSAEAVQSALDARDEGLLTPILVGPEPKIRAAAEAAGVSLAGVAIESTEHSHAAAERSVQMAARGEVYALMKGSLHSDELLGAVVAATSGLRTARRISHVYVLDVPAYSKLLVVTDAAINIAPTLVQKRDICQNAIDFLQRLGVKEPLVAILAAVETVDPSMPATLDAAALAIMAQRGQITGAKVDGPLAFDNAISLAAAKIKSIVSPVAGRADILVVPDLEAGNMLAKQLIYLANARAAGLVLGARVPIILTSRADSLQVRRASAALAKLIGSDRQKTPDQS